MALETLADGYQCSGPARCIQISSGPANQLKFAHFALSSHSAWDTFAARVRGLDQQEPPAEFARQGSAIAMQDPDGNRVVFTPPASPSSVICASAVNPAPALPPASLQHFALRTAQLPAMLDFYTLQLGFVLSDAVKDESGTLRAAFLRTNHLHHALALFAAPVACFDHQSFEAPDWASMKAWGDHMAALQAPIVWGIGRHGPGNDVFFMVRDTDGNLAEISSEIEHCAPDRPAGLWPHEERTLNLWGKAILRS